MPPKRGRGTSTHRLSRSSAHARSIQDVAQELKPIIDPSSSEASLPFDPTELLDTPNASSLTTPARPDAITSSTTTPNASSEVTSAFAVPSQVAEGTSTFPAIASPSNTASNSRHSVTRSDIHTGVTTPPRGKKLLSQPKHPGRRSQTRLQELQKADKDKKQAETSVHPSSSQDDRARGAPSRSRARGRGRGGFIDSGSRASPKAIASGPFGSDQAIQQAKQHVKSQTASRSRAKANAPASPSKVTPATKFAEDGKLVKQEVDREGDVSMLCRTRIFAEDGGYISSDGDEDGGRLNVEDLAAIDLIRDESEVDTFAPVRVARFAHKERAFGINADGVTNQDGLIVVDANDSAAAVAASERKQRLKSRELENMEDEMIFQGTYSDSESDYARPHAERKAGNHLVTTPNDVSVKEPPSSPEISRKSKGKLKARTLTGDEEDYQTRDERDEWERYQQDLDTIQDTLGAPSASLPRRGSVEKREDKVFLFQLPPTMPELISPTVKSEPDLHPNGNGQQIATDAVVMGDNIETMASPIQMQQTFPPGFVGKLRVHASGRVSLDWGGADMSLQMGSNASFLQDVIIANFPDAKEDEDTDAARTGSAMSMGQVKGKFILVPDLDEIMR